MPLLVWWGTLLLRTGLVEATCCWGPSGNLLTHKTFLHACRQFPWWRHQMKTFSALLAICAGNSPVPGAHGPVIGEHITMYIYIYIYILPFKYFDFFTSQTISKWLNYLHFHFINTRFLLFLIKWPSKHVGLNGHANTKRVFYEWH